ncbi:MAG: hypothetical protein KDD62_03650, partial [Bdellovibrionales bacterium]|nr:hypothetical protein [Bdellovibrionales bacterium]
VPDRYQVTKYAMYDYATTVKAMADGSQRFESPLEAIEYIRHLDRKVLSSIREEGVSREVAVRWSKISLEPIMGPIFEQQREQLIPDFDPKLAIIDMAIETQEPKNIPNSSVDLRMLKVKFRLKGSELVSVQALVHENLKPFYYFMPNTNEDVRTASFSYLPLEGPITFEVKDRFGYTARYTYDFTPLLRAGTWRKSENTGLYELRVPSKIFEGRGFENFLKGSKAKSDPNGLFVQSGPLPYVVF